MNILITSGGTREDIDPVRGITNYSTGQLGRLIATRFLQSGAQVTYLCSESAARPDPNANLSITTIRSTSQLKDKLETALQTCPFDAVIHSMAVSDFAPESPSNTKISSDTEYITIVLKRLPKVIKSIKKLQPNTVLVGFKLLAKSSEDDLINAAYKQMSESGSDYVLANALEGIGAGRHEAILLNRDGIIARMESKEEIADRIYSTLI